MSERNENRSEHGASENDQLVQKPSEKTSILKHPFLFYLNESILIFGGIPSILYFIVGIINGVFLLVQQDDYDKCIFLEKAAKIAGGKDPDDVSDLLKWHLISSTIAAWVLIVCYSLILFNVAPTFYQFFGVIY